MPSPVGHSISVALALPLLKPSVREKVMGWPFLFASIFVANSPDIDFLFGFLAGAPNRYHHQFTHSFLFAGVVGLVFALFFTNARKNLKDSFLPLFFYFSFLAACHVVLDYFCLDTTAPYGVMLFWPWSHTYFISTFPVFSDIQRSSELGQFFQSLPTQHNGMTVLRETFIIAVLVVFAQWGGRRYWNGHTRTCLTCCDYDRE